MTLTLTLSSFVIIAKVYKTKDNQYMAVGALEPQFYAKLLEVRIAAPCYKWEKFGQLKRMNYWILTKNEMFWFCISFFDRKREQKMRNIRVTLLMLIFLFERDWNFPLKSSLNGIDLFGQNFLKNWLNSLQQRLKRNGVEFLTMKMLV
jgi:hypothetical protein